MTVAVRSRLSLKRDQRPEETVEERLQKVLANAGLGSRRSLEERIEGGEIRVNGIVATVGMSVRAGDRVEVDGKGFVAVTTAPEEAQLLIYHKPEGEITTHDDPEGRRTVFERLPRLKGARWVSIGRLDVNTTGLLLVTTDGELAHAMMHPSGELEREYVCRVHGSVTDEILERLRNGVELEDGPARFDEIHVINIGEKHSWLRVVLREGRNREVRRLWESQGLTVSRLKRIRYGSIELPRTLRRGHHEIVAEEAYRALREQMGLSGVPQTLTLQPVIGVRRAARQQAEYRPQGKAPSSWNQASADEARELRAFDMIRDERTATPKRRKPARKAGPGGPGGGGNAPGRGGPAARRGKKPGARTGNARPGQGNRGGGGGNAPAWANDNPAAMRTFTPGGNKPGRPPRRGAAGKGRPQGERPPHANALPYGFPSDHAYARRYEDQPTSPGGNRGPRRNGPGNGPGGGKRRGGPPRG